MFVADLTAGAVNRRLSADQRALLARHGGRTVAFHWRAFRLAWRIQPAGTFAAASSLLEADAVLRAAGGEMHLRGDAKLLRLLSQLAEEIDWAAVVGGAFGPALAPRMLLAIERGRAALGEAVRRRTATAAEVAKYGAGARRFAAGVEKLSARLAAAEGRG